MPTIEINHIKRSRLIQRAGDIQARQILLDRAEELYESGELEASATCLHAEYYLADRLAYMLNPAPKNCIKIRGAEPAK